MGNNETATFLHYFILDQLLEPFVAWEDRQVSVNEGDPLQVCFNTDIGSAQAYTIDVAARAKGTNPATGNLISMTSSLGVIIYQHEKSKKTLVSVWVSDL